jgi:dihydrolipoamide dehydrogenase
MKKYDVLVIGSGGGGKITSPAARMGLKVACVEKSALGGTCLNRGCIPSKMLIHPADVAQHIKEAAKFDIVVNSNLSVNFERLIKRISATVDADSRKISEGYSKNPNIDFYAGEAKFISDKVIEVNGEEITADKIFITVGARPQIPEIPGLHGTPYMTSTEALRNTSLPKTLTVIGGGYIAVELGYAYAALGSQVKFLVRSQFLRGEDSEVSAEFTRVFTKNNPTILGVIPTKVEYGNHQFTVHYQLKDGQKSWVTSEALLIATGVLPNTDKLNLASTKIVMTPHGFIKVNDRLETAVPGVYSFGDCIGRYLFRHSANFEGEYLMRTVFETPSHEPISYPPVPHAVFCQPQIAGVGKTEDELKKEGVEYIVGMNPYKSSAMGMALLSDSGFCKILFDKKTQRILGAHIIGAEASNMIHMLIALIYKNGTLDDLLGMIYIHPALPEIVRNAARKAKSALDQPLATRS